MNFDSEDTVVKHKSTFDPVTRPEHYSYLEGVDNPINIAEQLGYCLGNAFKYMIRYPYKYSEPAKQLEDLHKAWVHVSQAIRTFCKKHNLPIPDGVPVKLPDGSDDKD